MNKLQEAVQHYVDLHLFKFPISVDFDLVQVARVHIYGSNYGEIIVSKGTSMHVDDDDTYIETISNPCNSYHLLDMWGNKQPLDEGKGFFLKTTQHHQLINEIDFMDEPWIGITIAGKRPNANMLRLYKHVLISSFSQGIGFTESSNVKISIVNSDSDATMSFLNNSL